MARSSKAKSGPPKRGAPTGGRRKFVTAAPEKGMELDYKDYVTLRTFMTEKGKIRARRITGLSRREQRMIALAIKRARELALVPYSER